MQMKVFTLQMPHVRSVGSEGDMGGQGVYGVRVGCLWSWDGKPLKDSGHSTDQKDLSSHCEQKEKQGGPIPRKTRVLPGPDANRTMRDSLRTYSEDKTTRFCSCDRCQVFETDKPGVDSTGAVGPQGECINFSESRFVL